MTDPTGPQPEITAVVALDESAPELRVVALEPDPLPGAVVVALPEAPGGGVGEYHLTDLADVDLRGPGLLHRGDDGTVRALSLGDVRTDIFEGAGPPPDVVPGAGYGDLWLDRASGDIYRLT